MECEETSVTVTAQDAVRIRFAFELPPDAEESPPGLDAPWQLPNWSRCLKGDVQKFRDRLALFHATSRTRRARFGKSSDLQALWA